MSRVNLRTEVFDEVINNPMIGLNHKNPRKIRISIFNINNRDVTVNKVRISIKLLFINLSIREFTLNRRVSPNSQTEFSFLVRELKNVPSLFNIRIDVFVDGEKNLGTIYSLRDLRFGL